MGLRSRKVSKYSWNVKVNTSLYIWISVKQNGERIVDTIWFTDFKDFMRDFSIREVNLSRYILRDEQD